MLRNLTEKKYSKLEKLHKDYFREPSVAFNCSLTRQHLTCYSGIKFAKDKRSKKVILTSRPVWLFSYTEPVSFIL